MTRVLCLSLLGLLPILLKPLSTADAVSPEQVSAKWQRSSGRDIYRLSGRPEQVPATLVVVVV